MVELPKRAAIFSSSSHLLACREYAVREGYTVVTEFVEETSDSSFERASIEALFTAAQEGICDVILIPELRTLSQESETAARIMITLESYMVRCISITQNILLGGEAGTFTNMVAAIRAKVAEIERERLAARRRAGRKLKRNAVREHV